MTDRFQINDPRAYRRADELDILRELAPPSGLKVLELGCGAAWMTRQVATLLGAARVTATEVDTIQHAKNLAIEDLPSVDFRLGGAEFIADADGTYDLVLMLKSFHHVPVDLMDRAMTEIHRVLVPGGLLYVSEPVYWGDFNEVMRLIHDELEVRTAAFEALKRAVQSGLFAHERELFFEAEGLYPDWERFAQRFIQVTHTDHALDDAQMAQIRAAFEQHLGPEGAHFLKPHRVDLLRRRP